MECTSTAKNERRVFCRLLFLFAFFSQQMCRRRLLWVRFISQNMFALLCSACDRERICSFLLAECNREETRVSARIYICGRRPYSSVLSGIEWTASNMAHRSRFHLFNGLFYVGRSLVWCLRSCVSKYYRIEGAFVGWCRKTYVAIYNSHRRTKCCAPLSAKR